MYVSKKYIHILIAIFSSKSVLDIGLARDSKLFQVEVTLILTDGQ